MLLKFLNYVKSNFSKIPKNVIINLNYVLNKVLRQYFLYHHKHHEASFARANFVHEEICSLEQEFQMAPFDELKDSTFQLNVLFLLCTIAMLWLSIIVSKCIHN